MKYSKSSPFSLDRQSSQWDHQRLPGYPCWSTESTSGARGYRRGKPAGFFVVSALQMLSNC